MLTTIENKPIICRLKGTNYNSNNIGYNSTKVMDDMVVIHIHIFMT